MLVKRIFVEVKVPPTHSFAEFVGPVRHYKSFNRIVVWGNAAHQVFPSIIQTQCVIELCMALLL